MLTGRGVLAASWVMHNVDGYALASADRMMLLCPSGLCGSRKPNGRTSVIVESRYECSWLARSFGASALHRVGPHTIVFFFGNRHCVALAEIFKANPVCFTCSERRDRSDNTDT